MTKLQRSFINGAKVKWEHTSSHLLYLNDFYEVVEEKNGRKFYSKLKLSTVLYEMRENSKDWKVYD